MCISQRETKYGRYIYWICERFQLSKFIILGILLLLPSIGYADGIKRALSNSGKILFYNNNGELYKAPILGSVSMDLLTCDVTTIPDDCTCIGHEAVLLDDNYTIDDMAAESGNIPLEILTGLNYRSSRMHINYYM